ncbi:hypothetical protein PI126_g17829 [Phytophthora idaei]|nr:hypothetical protein PI126_g17829 [Phytophthora idaei]
MLLNQRLSVSGSVRFDWDTSTGRVIRLESKVDLMTPMLQLLGSLEDVARVFDKALVTLDGRFPVKLPTLDGYSYWTMGKKEVYAADGDARFRLKFSTPIYVGSNYERYGFLFIVVDIAAQHAIPKRRTTSLITAHNYPIHLVQLIALPLVAEDSVWSAKLSY